MTQSIANILSTRGAWLTSVSSDQEMARQRASLTQRIAEQFVIFEQVRDYLLLPHEDKTKQYPVLAETFPDFSFALLEELMSFGVVNHHPTHHEVNEVSSRRYLTGGWLEELAWLAAHEAGMEEALHGQLVKWSVKGYSGENEIDLIVRKQGRLGFMSCKALRSVLNVQDRKHRNRLMDTVHEADNIADHFGRPGEPVAVLVTTDLYDEARDTPRYIALMGKAAALDVRVIALEELGWDRLVTAIADMMAENGAADDADGKA